MTNAYHDSKVTETLKSGQTFTWGTEHKHSMDTIINAGTHRLDNIPKCSNPNCVIKTKADWKFTEARDFARDQHCEFVVNINHIIYSRQIIDFATQMKGPLRGVPEREVNHIEVPFNEQFKQLSLKPTLNGPATCGIPVEETHNH
jgi:hypothetical protein